MREAIGGTWLFQIVIVLILLFAGFLALAINYTKAFKVKNEIINIIERNNGFTVGINQIDMTTEEQITQYLSTVGYRTTGICNEEDGSGYPMHFLSNKYYYCVRSLTTKSKEIEQQTYYKIKVFFNIDIPVINRWLSFSISGTTKVINDPIELRS